MNEEIAAAVASRLAPASNADVAESVDAEALLVLLSMFSLFIADVDDVDEDNDAALMTKLFPLLNNRDESLTLFAFAAERRLLGIALLVIVIVGTVAPTLNVLEVVVEVTVAVVRRVAVPRARVTAVAAAIDVAVVLAVKEDVGKVDALITAAAEENGFTLDIGAETGSSVASKRTFLSFCDVDSETDSSKNDVTNDGCCELTAAMDCTGAGGGGGNVETADKTLVFAFDTTAVDAAAWFMPGMTDILRDRVTGAGLDVTGAVFAVLLPLFETTGAAAGADA